MKERIQVDARPLLNIKLNAREKYAGVLSNIFETPFIIGERKFRCVEAALWGIKFEDTETQEALLGTEKFFLYHDPSVGDYRRRICA